MNIEDIEKRVNNLEKIVKNRNTSTEIIAKFGSTHNAKDSLYLIRTNSNLKYISQDDLQKDHKDLLTYYDTLRKNFKTLTEKLNSEGLETIYKNILRHYECQTNIVKINLEDFDKNKSNVVVTDSGNKKTIFEVERINEDYYINIGNNEMSEHFIFARTWLAFHLRNTSTTLKSVFQIQNKKFTIKSDIKNCMSHLLIPTINFPLIEMMENFSTQSPKSSRIVSRNRKPSPNSSPNPSPNPTPSHSPPSHKNKKYRSKRNTKKEDNKEDSLDSFSDSDDVPF